MTRRLSTHVAVHGGEDGTGASQVFGPDDELPEWAERRLIEHGTPGIWTNGDEPASGEAQATPEDLVPEIPEPVVTTEVVTEPDDGYDELERDVLKAIADQRGLDVDGRIGKAKLIEALRAADANKTNE